MYSFAASKLYIFALSSRDEKIINDPEIIRLSLNKVA